MGRFSALIILLKAHINYQLSTFLLPQALPLFARFGAHFSRSWASMPFCVFSKTCFHDKRIIINPVVDLHFFYLTM